MAKHLVKSQDWSLGNDPWPDTDYFPRLDDGRLVS